MKGEIKLIYDNFQPVTFWDLIEKLRKIAEHYEGFKVTWEQRPQSSDTKTKKTENNI